MKTEKKPSDLKSGLPRGKKPASHFPVVAIGASAGGIEAVTRLFQNLAADTGMAYIYIQHLDPSHVSLLSEILSKTTRMEVEEARNRLHILPDHVYVIPPNKEMTIVGGVLKLITRPAKPALSLPINQFFLSLAENVKEKAIGIVLSGNASDGAKGLKAIKMAGGITFAQDDSARFKSMPHAAISEDAADLVLPPDEIAKELERLSHQPAILHHVLSTKSEDDIPARFSEESLSAILVLLKKNTSVDFVHYKSNTIRRRIIRRMLLNKQETLQDYARFLKDHTAEANALYKDLLINVTSFFRDPGSMDYLKKDLFPRILKRKNLTDPFRIWIPACSTGEEAYSVAMILFELLGDKATGSLVQIFATDLSETAIMKARQGLYSGSDMRDISPKRIQRFFTKTDGSYRIIKPIRDLCIFAPHNVFKDPPFSRIDFISCRNLLIYLDTILQKKLISTFDYSLKPGGVLMLGKSESVGEGQSFFTLTEKKYRVYSHQKDNVTGTFPVSSYPAIHTDQRKNESRRSLKPHKREIATHTDLEKMVENILLNQYAPACVLVNHDLEILQFRGSTGLFLEPAQGKASLNLLKMARPGLGFELRNAIHKAERSGKSCKKSGLQITHNDTIHPVNIEVIPVIGNSQENHYLVVFEKMTPTGILPIKPSSSSREKRIKQLEKELLATREDMRSMLDQQEAINEELQSANEEIISSNEELQSVNEELETSKEEMESTNEELVTINQEIQVRNDQLAEAYEYAEAIVDTVREGILMLDPKLRVKSANRSFYNMFHVKEENTEGQLVYELGSGMWNIPKLRELLEEIIPKNSQFYGFEVIHEFPVIGKKVLALNARKVIRKSHDQQLILLAIEDITQQSAAKKIIAEREAWFHHIADNAPVLVWVTDANRQHSILNKTWLEFTGRTFEKNHEMDWTEIIHPSELERFLKLYKKNFDKRSTFEMEFRIRRYDGVYRWVHCNGKPIYDLDDTFTGYFGTCYEIHDSRVINEELEARVIDRTMALNIVNANLERSNDELQQFAYVASHDLQEPLRKIITFVDRMNNFSDNKLPSDVKKYLEKITTSSFRMKKLIEDLLSFSRVYRAPESFVKMSLRDILKDVIKDFDEHIRSDAAIITLGKLPVLEVVPLQMKQLFHNLISNALKFKSNSRKPLINLSSRRIPRREMKKHPDLDPTKSYIELLVRDNGIGFKKEFADQIFVIFQRLHDKARFEGTGIGLALCRKIASNHGGEIFAESKEHHGSVFHVILPVKQER